MLYLMLFKVLLTVYVRVRQLYIYFFSSNNNIKIKDFINLENVFFRNYYGLNNTFKNIALNNKLSFFYEIHIVSDHYLFVISLKKELIFFLNNFYILTLNKNLIISDFHLHLFLKQNITLNKKNPTHINIILYYIFNSGSLTSFYLINTNKKIDYKKLFNVIIINEKNKVEYKFNKSVMIKEFLYMDSLSSILSDASLIGTKLCIVVKIKNHFFENYYENTIYPYKDFDYKECFNLIISKLIQIDNNYGNSLIKTFLIKYKKDDTNKI